MAGGTPADPGFRIYGKNQAADKFNDMVKVKQRVRALTKNVAANDIGAQAGEFSFRGSITG